MIVAQALLLQDPSSESAQEEERFTTRDLWVWAGKEEESLRQKS